MEGNGVPADPARAVTLYQAVADQPYGPAQYALGLAYANGLGVPLDQGKALEWFKLADSFGVAEAQAQIDLLEAAPVGTPVDMSGFGREGPGY